MSDHVDVFINYMNDSGKPDPIYLIDEADWEISPKIESEDVEVDPPPLSGGLMKPVIVRNAEFEWKFFSVDFQVDEYNSQLYNPTSILSPHNAYVLNRKLGPGMRALTQLLLKGGGREEEVIEIADDEPEVSPEQVANAGLKQKAPVAASSSSSASSDTLFGDVASNELDQLRNHLLSTYTGLTSSEIARVDRYKPDNIYVICYVKHGAATPTGSHRSSIAVASSLTISPAATTHAQAKGLAVSFDALSSLSAFKKALSAKILSTRGVTTIDPRFVGEDGNPTYRSEVSAVYTFPDDIEPIKTFLTTAPEYYGWMLDGTPPVVKAPITEKTTNVASKNDLVIIQKTVFNYKREAGTATMTANKVITKKRGRDDGGVKGEEGAEKKQKYDQEDKEEYILIDEDEE